jgi:aspartate kinase
VPIVVQKYGGTSVAGPDEIKRVARRIVQTANGGNSVCAVVSAMGHTTDELIELARKVSPGSHPREQDMLLTAGERISVALVSMAILDLGLDAVSFTGSQAGIVTDTSHGKARIVEMRRGRVHEALEEGKIAIVAGFQGVSTEHDITTLGRGGSDTTAVALAAALNADVCEIYTDVEGVYTADQRIVPTARKLAHVSFDEMLEMAATGGRVLALRSVEFARNHGVQVHVRSSFTWAPGTWVSEETPMDSAIESMEQAIISGVTHDISEAKITIEQVPDQPGVAATIFRDLANAGVNVDMIVQNVSTAGHTDISFTVPRADTTKAAHCMEKIVIDTDAHGFRTDENIGRVSLVGAGMKTHPGVAAKMFETLATEGVNIEMISTSTIRISCVVAEPDVERAVQALHAAFELDKEQSA